MKISRVISVTGQKGAHFEQNVGCRANFASANDTVVFDKSAMYDT